MLSIPYSVSVYRNQRKEALEQLPNVLLLQPESGEDAYHATDGHYLCCVLTKMWKFDKRKNPDGVSFNFLEI